jgi:hypothetical protein
MPLARPCGRRDDIGSGAGSGATAATRGITINLTEEQHALREQARTLAHKKMCMSGESCVLAGENAGDFPDYVDAAVTAPAKINDYRALRFVVIVS